MILPTEYYLDVPAATEAVTRLSQSEPEKPLLLTFAELIADGLSDEEDVILPATAAAALLETVDDEQRVTVGGKTIFLLRVGEPNLPPQPAVEEF